MKIVLVHDEPVGSAPVAGLPPDIGREFETESTVEALLSAIRACGHEPDALALGLDFPARIRDLVPDLVFNVAEGWRGRARESIVPAWLDHLSIPYTGSDGLTMAVSLDKALTKEIAAAHGGRTPAFRRVRAMADLATVDLPFPLFVKPNAEGSNMGVRSSSRVATREALAHQVQRILRDYPGDCLVETFVPGLELCFGLLGNNPPVPLAVAEVRPAANLYDREDAPLRHEKMICPVDLPGKVVDEMRRMTLAVFHAIGCRDMARADFMLDADGQPTFLEINPIPCLSPVTAVFPLQARVTGIPYDDLIGRIIEAAAARSA